MLASRTNPFKALLLQLLISFPGDAYAGTVKPARAIVAEHHKSVVLALSTDAPQLVWIFHFFMFNSFKDREFFLENKTKQQTQNRSIKFIF